MDRTTATKRYFQVIVGTLLAMATAGPAVAAKGDRLVFSTHGDVPLGYGWDSQAGHKATGYCISFQPKSSSKGQRAQLDYVQVIDEYSLNSFLHLDASMKLKLLSTAAKAGAGSISSLSLDRSFHTIAVHLQIDDRVDIVVPPKTSDAQNPTEPGLVSELLELFTGPLIEDRLSGFDLAAVETAYDGAITLTPAAASWARSDPAKFSKVCGDSYVASVNYGGELIALVNTNKSSERKTEKTTVTGALEEGQSGAAFSAKVDTGLDILLKSSKGKIWLYTVGGAGATAVTAAELQGKISAFSKEVRSDPYPTRMEVSSYSDLSNCPKDAKVAVPAYADIDDLVFHSGKWLSLFADIDAVEKDKDRYLFGRGITLSKVTELHNKIQDMVVTSQEAVEDVPMEVTVVCQKISARRIFRSDPNSLYLSMMQVQYD